MKFLRYSFVIQHLSSFLSIFMSPSRALDTVAGVCKSESNVNAYLRLFTEVFEQDFPRYLSERFKSVLELLQLSVENINFRQ